MFEKELRGLIIYKDKAWLIVIWAMPFSD